MPNSRNLSTGNKYDFVQHIDLVQKFIFFQKNVGQNFMQKLVPNSAQKGLRTEEQ